MRIAHVAVIGAGIGGLLAAAALAPHADEITLLEADDLPDGPVGRVGVPQGSHSHVLLARGRRAFEELLPGFDAALAAHARDEVDWTGDCHVFSGAGRVPRFSSTLVTRPCTRPLLEWCVRERVLAVANVKVQKAKVTGVHVEDGAVRGVAIAGDAHAADLVVDAAGRRSRTAEWLVGMGLLAPAEQVVDAHLGYATRLFERAPGMRDFKGLVISSRPPSNPRAAALWPIENDQWLVTLAGTAGTYPPTDEAGFLAFAKELQSEILFDTIRTATPTTKIHGFRNTENRWHRYDRLETLPDGLVVIGDGVCTFNPVYGQGMTVAALEAQALARLVETRASLRGLPRAYFRAAVRAIEPAWLLATSEDSRWPQTVGSARGFGARAQYWYIDRLMELTPTSPKLVELFLSIVHMVRSPNAFARPDVAAQVLTRAAIGART